MTDACKHGFLPLRGWAVLILGLLVAGAAAQETAEAPRTGAYRTAFAEPSPYAAFAVFTPRCNNWFRLRGRADEASASYRLGDEQFDVYVPADYAGGRAFGAVVFLDASDGGAPPAGYADICDALHLVWVGAAKASAHRDLAARWRLALDGVHNLALRYHIDPERVYVTGNGGKEGFNWAQVQQLAISYPELFAGALVLQGAREVFHPSRDGDENARLLGLARKRRFVLIRDPQERAHGFDLSSANAYADFANEHFPFVTQLEEPGLDAHGGIPSPLTFAKAVQAADGQLVEAAKDDLAEGRKQESARHAREALAAYTRAAACGADDALAASGAQARARVAAALEADAAKELAPLLAAAQAGALRAFVTRWPAELPSAVAARAAAEHLGGQEWAKLAPGKPPVLALRDFTRAWNGYTAAAPAFAALDAYAQQAWQEFGRLSPGASRTRALARFPDQWDGTATGARAREQLRQEVRDGIEEIKQLPEATQIARLQALLAELRGSKLGKEIDARIDELDKAQQGKAKAGK
jgi:hypothetical protein